jgi:hypothetical protein
VTGDDAVGRLAVILDNLEGNARVAETTIRRSERNRIGLLHVHAFFAAYIGAWFATLDDAGLSGTAFTIVRAIPGVPISLALLLLTGGVILGAATWRRVVRWEMVGLCMLLSWYVIITVSFAGALVWWWLGYLPPGTPKPAPYAHGVYAHFGAVMIIHLVTLIRKARLR